MLKDYDTPNFKTPPKKLPLNSSKTALLNSTPFITTADNEVSIEEIERKVWETVNSSRKMGVSAEKLEEIKENAYKDVIRNQKIVISRLVSEQERLIKVVQENMDEKIKQKNHDLARENDKKFEALLSDNKVLKEKYSKLKSRYLQTESKLKTLSTESEKLREENSQLLTKNHAFLQDASKLQQLSEEMKSFEQLRFQNAISALERRLLEKTQENQALKQAKSATFLENPKEKPAKLTQSLQRLVKENHQLVATMQNALDSCPSSEIYVGNSRDLQENSRKTEKFLEEIAEFKAEISAKELIIAEMREKLAKTEQKLAQMEVKAQFFQENEARFREELERTRSLLEKPAKSPENREISEDFPRKVKEISEIEEKNAQLLREIAVERGLREQYFESIKELERILRELLNEGELFRSSVKKTVSEESRKVIEKYRLVFEEKQGNSNES